ncbi:MAG: 2-dehydropantoate 2-reductase [Deltaproteobacteria bacterium]|nr:2-dehydropantoate 2-reductase [Deltaproteobacteria bacterium]
MKIAIIGPGALGCLLAALLVEAGEDAWLVDYRPERVALLGRQGIRLRTQARGERQVKVPIGLPQEVGPAEVAMVAVKAHQTSVAARDLPRLLTGGGLALTLQNGLGNLEILAGAVGPERLLAGVALLGVTRQAEGDIILAGPGAVIIGIPAGSLVSPAELKRLVEVLRRAGLTCRQAADVEALLWEKLLINVGINPLTALLRVTNGALPQLGEAWVLAVAAATEALAVARAAGVDLTVDPEARLRQVCTATAANRASMLQDVLAGRPTEIEALNGQVVARGAALGVPTPVNDFLTKLLRAAGRTGPFQVSSEQ